ncbi:Outer membrane protein U [Vibrio chagasii]|nr:Outer membrane protein U [Vibrio chagasii]CAH6810733.1 Outer membrane protein U [Vibrio chagasii]CAH6998651.1 Outer membrane protein U [Vibrio chagasii]CAH7016297.1 Outer membrane protein U [Vibrio chagasii]CAH7160887.1 Outer membrane protein U [Vibrio chagasii]
MNKTMIALAVSAAALATNAVAADGKQAGGIDGTSVYSSNGTSLEIGGRAEARLSLKDGKAEDNTRVRLNFLGKVEIQDGLYGVGFYEAEYNANDYEGDADSIDHRYTYAGLGGTFGEVTYGKNDGALGVITDFTDIMSYHGNSAAYKIAAADRTDNMLSYKGQFQDLAVKASYRFADRGETAGEFTDNNEDGYSLSGIYSIGDSGVKLGAGYADQNEQNEYMLAASYRTEALYFAGTFTDGELAKDNGDYTGYEFATAYTLDKTAFTLTYNNAEFDNETAADNVAIDATYYFKPNFRTYISYNFNLISEGDKFGDTKNLITRPALKTDAEDELAIGLRYDF